MPRELVYRVAIDTSQARRAAASIKSEIEHELKNINVGNLNTSGAGVSGIAAQYKAATTQMTGLQQGAQGAQAAIGGLNTALGTFGLALGAAQVIRFTTDLGRLQTESARARKSFELLSGSVAEMQANVQAIQRASNGTVSALEAMKIGGQASALGLAKTSDEFERLTKTARLITLVSASINDTSEAISQLALFASNVPSFARADQLGLSAQEVKDRMAELQAQNEYMTDSNAKLEASMQLIIEKFGNQLDTVEAQASGFEKLSVAIEDARRAAAEGPIIVTVQRATGMFAEDANALLGLGNVSLLNDALYRQALNAAGRASQDNASQATQEQVREIEKVRDALKKMNELFELDPQATSELRQVAIDIAESVALRGTVTDQEQVAVQALLTSYYAMHDAAKETAEARKTALQAEDSAEARAASLLEQQAAINDAAQNRALKAADTVGFDYAFTTLKEQEAQIDAAITELINSSITDPSEIDFKLAEITAKVTAFYDNLEAGFGGSEIDFAGFDTALQQFDQGFVDFLPGLDDLRNQLIDLQAEVALTGSMTAEQAAEFDYLSAVAAAAGGDAALLSDVTRQLGDDFLYSNETAAALVDQMYLAAASYMSGAISDEQMAGTIAALGEQLLQLAGEAGVATGALVELINVQNAVGGGSAAFQMGVGRGSAIGQRIETQRAARQRDAARRGAEAAAKRAAAEQERAAKKAASELEKGAKQARQELESALKKVPGLFGRSQVTEKDMRFSEAGAYQNNADEYLRRLEDEVKNGVDWANVSIEDAKQALRDLGVQVADDNKIAFEQFADAYESGLLFFDPENIKKFIDEEAVKRNLDLQEKARIGQENILAAFGAGIDGAVAAATTGIAAAGGSGSATTGYTIPIKAELIPMTAGAGGQTMPTLGGVSPVIDIAAIQGQSSTLTVPPLTLTADLDDTAGQTLIGELSTQIAGLAPTLQAQGKILGAIMGSGLAFGENAGATLINDLGTQIAGQQALVEAQGKVVGAILSSGIRTSFAEQPFGTDVVTALGAQFGANSAAIQEHGKTIGMLMQAGLAASWTGEGDTGAAMMLLSALSAQFTATQNFFYGIGQIPAQTVKDGFINYFSTGSEGGGQLVTPMLTSLGTGIRAASADLRQRGGTMARELVYGFTSSFNSDEFKSVVVAAGETMGAYLEIGILSRIRGGALVEAIGAQVLADITETIEQPTN